MFLNEFNVCADEPVQIQFDSMVKLYLHSKKVISLLGQKLCTRLANTLKKLTNRQN